MFFIKSFCVFFISAIIGFCIWAAEKKTTYYLVNTRDQKTEITKLAYTYLNNTNKYAKNTNDITHLYKKEISSYKNALLYGAASFICLMIFVSLFEIWKNKNNTSII
jgi:hypothetical protein